MMFLETVRRLLLTLTLLAMIGFFLMPPVVSLKKYEGASMTRTPVRTPQGWYQRGLYYSMFGDTRDIDWQGLALIEISLLCIGIMSHLTLSPSSGLTKKSQISSDAS